MNKDQEDLIATGLYLLIKNHDKIRSSTKKVWIDDYDKLFPEVLTDESGGKNGD